MRYVYFSFAFFCVLTFSLLGVRGTHFTKPPLMVFPDTFFPEMNHQAKYKPQAASTFFADGRSDRPLPAGVVSRNPLREDSHLYRGKTADGQWARGFPAAVTVDARLMARGRERFTIYCQPCHGALGDGKGIVTQYNWGAPANFHSDVFRAMADGQTHTAEVHEECLGGHFLITVAPLRDEMGHGIAARLAGSAGKYDPFGHCFSH